MALSCGHLMTRPSPLVLESTVEKRYAGLATAFCSLSCGEALALAAPVLGEVLVDFAGHTGFTK
jgi:hypothetical protein